MHAHILIFSKDFREPLSRFLELSCCVVLSSLELCPATFSCLGLPEPQPSFPQLSETAMVCWGHLLPPPSFPWPAVCSQGDLRAHVICLCPVRNHSSVLPAVQCLQTVVPCVLFSFLVHSKKVHVVSITPSETAAVCWLILSGAVTLSLTSFHPECQVLLLTSFHPECQELVLFPLFPYRRKLRLREIEKYAHSHSVINTRAYALAAVPVPLKKHLLN